jgi:hypothetical protein
MNDSSVPKSVVVDFRGAVAARRNRQAASHYAELIEQFRNLIALTETVMRERMRCAPPDERREIEAAIDAYRGRMDEAIRSLERMPAR